MTNCHITSRTQDSSDYLCRMTVIKAKRVPFCTKANQWHVADITTPLGFENPSINLSGGRTEDRCPTPHPGPAIVDAFFTKRFRSRDAFSSFAFVCAILERICFGPCTRVGFFALKTGRSIRLRVFTPAKHVELLTLSALNTDFSFGLHNVDYTRFWPLLEGR